MRLKNKSMVLLVMGLSLMSYGDISALTLEELNGYALSSHGERIIGSSRFEAYLKKKGVNINEYNKYLKKFESYMNSKEELWEQVESGTILIDQILFADKEVRAEYEKALKKLDSEYMAYIFVKKNIMNDSERFVDIFENNMTDLKKIRSAFESKFKRKVNGFEEIFINNLETIKHALYAGANGGYLRSEEEELSYDAIVDYISTGKGYIVMNLTETQIGKYMDFVKEREKYDKLLMPYIKTYSMFETINSEIGGKYKIDIFKELSDKERLNIYNASIRGFIFDEDVARKKVIDTLVSKNVLSKEDLVEDESVKVNNGYTNVNPWAEINKYLKNNSSIGNVQSLSSMYSGNGVSAVLENLGEKYIYVKYGELDINTYLRLTKDGFLKSVMVSDLIELLKNELELKTVLSKKEILTFFNNEINKFGLVLEEDKDISFKEISKILKDIGIELYLKDIGFESNKINGDLEDTEDVGVDKDNINYKMNIHLKDKLVVYDLGDSNKVQVSSISEILDALDIKCIISTDSILLYKNGEIKISKVLGLQDKEITMDKFKALLDDVGEKVNINVIRETI